MPNPKPSAPNPQPPNPNPLIWSCVRLFPTPCRPNPVPSQKSNINPKPLTIPTGNPKLPRAPLTICMGARGFDRGPRPSVPSAALPCPALPAARTHNPTPIHLSIAWLWLRNVVVYVSNSERKQRARKPPLRGCGVNPKP